MATTAHSSSPATADGIETHPWEPFVPSGARVLIMGTFPPQPKRWSMGFYYPNRTNDFWPMMGLIFLGSRQTLVDTSTRDFRLDLIKQLLTEHGIALHDTCRRIRRLRDNASDKFLEVVEPVPLQQLLATMPHCHAVATTGEKAASIVAEITGTEVPRMGCMVQAPAAGPFAGLSIWRMPSTSRAYPLALEKKAEYYAAMFRSLGILSPL